ncbi:MAG: 4Fe-4S binding protein [Lentisphaerae bacterium]|nr:4Fe-4S binding protein [Lentisphaerota bacterium]
MKGIMQSSRVAAAGIIFALGFFGLAAQTLLFRDFLTAFEGHELGIALFFSCWLLWVAIGALLGRWRSRATDWVGNHFEFLALLYLPAYVLQEWLIGNARSLAEVKPYELFPLAKMIPVALLANAPVSLCCGWLFTRACQWQSATQPLPVARVYILEALGSFAGGVGVTLLLALGVSAENVGLTAAMLPALALFLYRSFKHRNFNVVAGVADPGPASARPATVVSCRRPNSKKQYISALLPLLIILAAQLAGLGNFLERARNLRAWQRLLPEESYRGNFITPQARYLYGEYQGQINVMAWQTVLDSIPNAEHASEVIALHLAQHPRARKFLIIGSGSFSIAKRLLDLPQAETITWLDPDPDYPRRLLSVLPETLRSGVDRLEIPTGDIRRYLSESKRSSYDLVILNLPAIRTLALNRYFTREFFLLVKEHLAAEGVLSVRITAGENYMGDELVNAGASVFYTLSSVFQNLTLKPGEESWLLASDGGELSAAPAVLRDRFRALEGAERLYPPEGLLSLYLPDRISYQLANYSNAVSKAPSALLLNTDRQPKALLHSLLFAAREAGTTLSLNYAVRALALSGALLMPLAVLLYGLLRRLYQAKGRRRALTAAGGMELRIIPRGVVLVAASFDDYFLVFSAGAVSMGLSIVLMFMYQSVYGSLFLHVGLVSALFMLGLTLGSLISQNIITNHGLHGWHGYGQTVEGRAYSAVVKPLATKAGPSAVSISVISDIRGKKSLDFLREQLPQNIITRSKRKIAAGLLPLGILFVALLALVIRLLPGELSQGAFCALFICAGLLGGVFVPMVAARWSAEGQPPATAGAMIELSDHLGGAWGGLLIGLLLVPVFGNAYTLGILALFLLVNLAAWPMRRREALAAPYRFASRTRAAGYAMFGLAIFALGAALIFRFGERDTLIRSFHSAAEALSGPLERVPQSSPLESGQELNFFLLRDTNAADQAYIFSTEKLSGAILGYGGPITLAVRSSPDGRIEGFRIIESNETPAYLDALAAWFQKLVGKKLFGRATLEGIDAVTGATMTSAAIIKILRKSGQSFARQALNLDIAEQEAELPAKRPSARFLVFSALAVMALVLRVRPTRGARRVFLLLAAGVLGVALNVQYSSAHMFSLLGLKLPAPAGNEAFLLIVILPVIILLFGNIYCGYLCPFGALQELIGEVRPPALDTNPSKQVWRYGRFTKFVILFLLVLWFATSLSPALASHDPLTTIFSKSLTPFVVAIVTASLALSFFFNRFWCRNLCPAGAVLALLNGVHLLKPFIPVVNPQACVFGVTADHELDCLCCDRCRMGPAAPVAAPKVGAQRHAIFLIAVLVLAALFAHKGLETWGEERAKLAIARSGIVTGGSPRNVDIRRIKRLIEQRSLSGHEAVYYKTVGGRPAAH